MIDPVAAYGSAPVTDVQSHLDSHTSPLPVNPADVSVFEAALHGEDMRVAQLDPAQSFGQSELNPWIEQPGPAEVAPVPSLSSSLMNELQDMRDTWQDLRGEMAETRADPDRSAEDMLGLAAEFAHANVMFSFVTQSVTALSAGVGQLMKAQ